MSAALPLCIVSLEFESLFVSSYCDNSTNRPKELEDKLKRYQQYAAVCIHADLLHHPSLLFIRKPLLLLLLLLLLPNTTMNLSFCAVILYASTLSPFLYLLCASPAFLEIFCSFFVPYWSFLFNFNSFLTGVFWKRRKMKAHCCDWQRKRVCWTRRLMIQCIRFGFTKSRSVVPSCFCSLLSKSVPRLCV